ncbi:MAG: hypothetical protein CMJ06_01955 [Pelagibacterales bacterium]|nr:hypothetical protein [Pelagibacterales bacterium]OUU63187.1 MAG: hypothetical protein CBC22_01925 [Alphaproteobacteria bacterium TMED62]|tara:strand:- start:3527 stop:4156 length:630 start_codon:yes stop_codon:yes gene_type:complete
MVKLTSNKLNSLLKKVYSLSRKSKNETILIWIFLDSDRIKDYEKFINLIPPNKKIGIVLRCRHIEKRYLEAKKLLKLCKKKKFTFLVSSSYIIAKSIGADGVHYPNKYNYCKKDPKILTTCSYHGYNDIKRIKQLSVGLVFISPIFSTKSDINKKETGLIRISFLANYLKYQYSVLGGVKSNNIKSLRNRGIKSISGLDIIFDVIGVKC